MSVFTTKANGQKVTVVATNVAFVTDNGGQALITFNSGDVLQTEVGYDSVRRNVAKALSGAEAEAE